jgi:cytochrome P450
VGTVLHETEKRIFQFLPFWKLPFSSGTKIFQESKQVLLQEITSMIQSRRAKGVSPDDNDLLGRLLAAEDEETGEKITDEQLRDELITFLIAGHGLI